MDADAVEMCLGHYFSSVLVVPRPHPCGSMVTCPCVLAAVFKEKLYLANACSYGRSDTGFGVVLGGSGGQIEHGVNRECWGH